MAAWAACQQGRRQGSLSLLLAVLANLTYTHMSHKVITCQALGVDTRVSITCLRTLHACRKASSESMPLSSG